MMNQYRNGSSRTGGCGLGRSRETASAFPRTPCGCNSPSRPAPFGGYGDSSRTPRGGYSPAEGASCPLNHRNGHPRREGCGCEGGRNDCGHLMDRIRAVDFALYETVLYLDAYPHSCDALETYHKLKAQSEALHKEYETACGPLTAFGNHSKTSWDWMSKPFPWEYDAD